MKNQDDQLLRVMARRNWYILALLVFASLFWRSADVTKGVLAGGLVAIAAYGWRYRSLAKTLANPSPGAAKGFQIGYIVRLVALAAAIFWLMTRGGVNPLALALGLSVVIINVFWTTIRRLY